MNLNRILGALLRYLYFFNRFEHMIEIFFFPTAELFIWGVTSVWLQKADSSTSTLAIAILVGLVFWQLIWRSSYEISVNLLHEFWSRNLMNLFTTPLKLREWMCALMCMGLGKMLLALGFGGLVVWVLYSMNIFILGPLYIPFCAQLLLSGWFMGFLAASFMIRFGMRLQILAWMTPFVFMPFSAVFYPVTALPSWAQPISKSLPMTYLFEGMRYVLEKGIFSWFHFWMGLFLNLLYFFFGTLFFAYCFEKSRAKGLGRFE